MAFFEMPQSGCTCFSTCSAGGRGGDGRWGGWEGVGAARRACGAHSRVTRFRQRTRAAPRQPRRQHARSGVGSRIGLHQVIPKASLLTYNMLWPRPRPGAHGPSGWVHLRRMEIRSTPLWEPFNLV